MQSSRTAAFQAAFHARGETVVSVGNGAVAVEDDGTAFAAGAVSPLGIADGTVEEELLEAGTDGAPPVGFWSGDASGEAAGLDDGIAEDDDREGVTEGSGGATVE